jgi:hypothetical protein
MLLEWIEYLRTRSNKMAQEWGYTYQNVSLKFRSRRCKEAWRHHIDQCHQLVREQVLTVKPKSVMVLGSGLLLEIPLEALLESCEKIFLVDLVHAAKIRKLAKKFPQIKLIEKDLSSVLGFLKKGQAPFVMKSIPWDQLPAWDLPKVDWVISANLMSQIPLIISETLPMSSKVYADFARRLRDLHIERTCSQGKQGLLFADFETSYRDRDGELLKKESYKVTLGPLKFLKEWEWEISPYGETSKDYKVEMLVKAYAY